MPSVTSNIPDLEQTGPILEVYFSISTELENKYKQENKSLPEAILVKALIDTGASSCVVKQEIPEKLGLEPVNRIKMTTASDKEHECYQYFMRMIIPAHNLTYEGTFIACPLDGQDISCLIGRDILKSGILIYIGYANQFTFSLL